MLGTLVTIPVGTTSLAGELDMPSGATAVVVFAHGSGSSRHSPRNQRVAAFLRERGSFGTLLFDLLTPQEDTYYQTRFDIPMLAERLFAVTDWVRGQPATRGASVGYFGASTGAAAALIAASRRDDVAAVVSRGGRPDLAGRALSEVFAPTLLVVGGADHEVIELNRSAMTRMRGPVQLEIVPGATHLFEEPGALETVSGLARVWFERYLV